jgi:nitrogen-specific signal transduction histidine kinase
VDNGLLKSLLSILTTNIFDNLFDWRLLLVFLALLFLSVTCYLASVIIRKNNQLRENEKILLSRGTQHNFYKTLLDFCPAKWLIWTPEQDSLIVDPRLADYLDLQERYEIPFKEFSNCFLSSDVELMREKLVRFKDTGTAFEIKLTLKKDKSNSIFIVKSIEDAPHTSYVLWFRETLSPTEMSTRALSNKILNTLLNSLPVPIWLRGEDGQLTYRNQKYAEILETTPQLALKKDQNLWSGSLTTDSEGNRHLTEHTVIDGARHYLEYIEAPVTEIKGYLGYALDHTQTEKLHKELDRHLAGHREILENVASAVVIYDPEKRLAFFNHAYARMYEMDETWLHTHPLVTDVLDNLHKRRLLTEHADFPAFKQRTIQMFKSLLNPIQELLHLPDERTIRTVVAPHPGGGLLFVFEDVTDSLIIQRQANTQHAVQKETLDHLYEGVAVFASDNKLKLVNPAFARLWKLSQEFLEPGRHISDIIEQIKGFFDYGENWETYKHKIIENVTDRIPKNGRLTRKDDTILDFTYVPLPDGAHLISYTDVSDSYRAERALRERNQALETADRIKSEFLHSFSFDLKAPINTIIGFGEILSDQYFGNLNPQQTTYCKGILDSSNQLLTLVNDIIDLATIEAGQMNLNLQPVEPKSVLNSVASIVNKRIKERKLTLTVTCAPDIGEFVADERRLKQALINLIQNSIKFTQAGGKVSLTASRIGQNLHLTVSDTGSGISRKDQKRIFRKFERTDDAMDRYDGIGLGLSLVKSLVELHGGRVMMSSKQKAGTKVTCIIPMNLQQIPQPKLPHIRAYG